MARYWAFLEFVRSAEIVKIFLSYCRGCHSRYGFIALNALDRSHSRVEIRRATGSRTEVVELLRRGVCTVAEIAGRLHLTRNAVRFHLASLRRAGLVRTTGTRPGKRRAHATYELTEQVDQRFPNAYKLSLQQLLTELKHRYSRRIFTAIVRSAGDRLAKAALRKPRLTSLRSRAREAGRLIEAIGGSITIEPDHGTFLLHGEGCPLAAVVAHHPEVCKMVEHFLARSTGASVKQQCHHGPNPRCRFQIRNSAQS